MRQPELRLMAPPGESVCVADLQELSAGTEKASVSSAGSRQQSMSVVTARQSTSEPTSAEMSVVPRGSVSAKQPLYYDSQFPGFCVCHLRVILDQEPVSYTHLTLPTKRIV